MQITQFRRRDPKVIYEAPLENLENIPGKYLQYKTPLKVFPCETKSKLYRNEVAWVLVWILDFIFCLTKIAEFRKFSKNWFWKIRKHLKWTNILRGFIFTNARKWSEKSKI